MTDQSYYARCLYCSESAHGQNWDELHRMLDGWDWFTPAGSTTQTLYICPFCSRVPSSRSNFHAQAAKYGIEIVWSQP